jgi:hypothetical protein
MACAAQTAGILYGQMGGAIVCMAARRHPVLGKWTDGREAEIEN